MAEDGLKGFDLSGKKTRKGFAADLGLEFGQQNLASSNDITVTKFLNNPVNDTSVTKFMDAANDTSVTKFLN